MDSPERFDHDGFWKALIKRFFPSLLKRALPKLYEDADISQALEFLDKEFMDVLSTGDPKIRNSPYFADYLMDVAMKKRAGGAGDHHGIAPEVIAKSSGLPLDRVQALLN
jgi:hypothetical protein